MSKKRLEEAIQAGKAIEQGDEIPNYFEKIEEFTNYEFDEKKFGVYSLQFAADRDQLAVGYGDGSIEIVSSKNGKKDLDIKKPKHHQFATSCLRFHPKQVFLFLAASAAGTVHLCSRIDGTCEEIVTEQNNQIFALSFNNDGRQFATVGSNCDVHVYDTNTVKMLHNFEGYKYDCPDQDVAGHARRIFALKYHPDHEDVFITGGWDNALKVWDIRTKDGLAKTISGPHICGDGLDIKGLQILTASWRATDALEIYDFAMNRRVKAIPFSDNVSGEFLYGARYCENDVVVAGGSGTNSMKAIHLPSEKEIGEISLGDHPVQTVDVVHGGRGVALAGGGTVLKVARLC